jgi:multiple sugar transport system ATP-binding protein
MAEIRLDGISKRFADGTQAVHPTDLVIADGEFFILVGPSGCGKSTLLNMIVGLESPSAGEIRVDGRPVTGLDPKDRNMAMVFQSYAIYPHMTVRENMAFPLRIAKLDRAEIAARVTRAAEILELGALLERRPAALSGGQRQRVAMGRAIVREPAAFLLDEPLSNLDAKLRVQMRTELARLQKRLGTTTVYVTHDQTEAMTLGDRVAVLRRGEVQQVGTPRELYERPANLFVAGFIGSPAMNFLPADVEGDRVRLPMVELPLPERFRGRLAEERQSLIVGIRPEDLGDARLAGDGAGPSFRVPVEVVEWLGADLFVHFDVATRIGGGLGAFPEDLDLDLSRDGRLRLVARLGSASHVAEGEALELYLNPDALTLFDPGTGARIDPCAQSDLP